MSMKIEESKVTFDSVIYEDEIEPLREYLQTRAPESVDFDFSACDDLHLAVMQLIMAYKKLYTCSYEFGDKDKLYKMTLEGFNISENCCS